MCRERERERSGKIFLNFLGPILATENLKMHMILALLNFIISFLAIYIDICMYVYSQQKK
jgi:hypothetical protein